MHTWNAAAFAYDMYEGFQRKEQTVAVAMDLEDACNRVQFRLLMDLLVQVSLVLTRWTAGAPLEKYNGPITRITTLPSIHRWLTSDPVSYTHLTLPTRSLV